MNRVVRNSAEFGTASMGKCVAIIVRRRGSGATMHRGSRGVLLGSGSCDSVGCA